MREQALSAVRTEAQRLLGSDTTAMEPQALYRAIKDGIQAETEARSQARGARSTLVLNGLLALELQMWTQVFGQPRPAVKADF